MAAAFFPPHAAAAKRQGGAARHNAARREKMRLLALTVPATGRDTQYAGKSPLSRHRLMRSAEIIVEAEGDSLDKLEVGHWFPNPAWQQCESALTPEERKAVEEWLFSADSERELRIALTSAKATEEELKAMEIDAMAEAEEEAAAAERWHADYVRQNRTHPL